MIFTKDGSPYKKESYINGTYYIEDDDVVFEDCNFHNCKVIEPNNLLRGGLQNLTFKKCIFDRAEIALHCRKSDFSTCLIKDSQITDRRTIESYSENKFPEPLELCPKKGKFTAYKLLTLFPNLHYKEFRGLYLVSCGQELQDVPFIIGTLEIPDDALRVNGYGEKCRSSEATLINARPLFYNDDIRIKNAWDKLNNLYNNPDVFNALYHYGSPLFSQPMEYEIGKTNMAYNYNGNYLYECAGGIHFYMEEQYVAELGCGIFKHRQVMSSFSPICSGLNSWMDQVNYMDLYRKRIAHILERLVSYVEPVSVMNRENI